MQFKKPFPKDDYRTDVLWNEFPLAAMHYVAEADRVFSKDPETWGKKEDMFYSEMVAGLQDLGIEV